MSDRKKYVALVVVLRVIDVKTDKVDSETIKTIDSAERRKWIQDTVIWATMNGKYIEIINKVDDNE